MSNKIKAYFDENDDSIRLQSDAKKGDHIQISELTSFDRYIDKEITTKYKTKIINDYKSSTEYKEHQKELEFNKEEINKLNLLKIKLENEINSFKEKEKNIQLEAVNNFKKSEEFIKLQKVKEENIVLKEKLEQSEELIKTKTIDEFKKSNEFINKENQIKTLIEEKNNLSKKIQDLQHNLDKHELETINKLNVQEKTLNEIIQNKNTEINNLKKEIEYNEKRKKEMSIKQLGENFEQECLKMYDETLGQSLEDCVFKKAELIGGCKPDFVFEVYTYNIYENVKENPLLGKVILEMKTEQKDSENKKSNKDHLKKLEKDRINANADFALLITELEREDNFYIKRDVEYKNIIIARPEAMTSLLSILRVIFLKNKDIVLEEIEFKDKKEILEEFNEFKENLLNQSIKKINDKVLEIEKSAKKIIDQGNDILESVRIILDSHLNTVKNKINDFSINKILKKINDE